MNSKISECLESDAKYVMTVVISIILVIFVYWIIELDYDNKVCSKVRNETTNSTTKSKNNTVNIENFYVSTQPKDSYCSECGTKGRRRCGECVNCGFCYTPNGYGECIPGDENGPYFREDCLNYEYTTPIIINDQYYPRLLTDKRYNKIYNKPHFGTHNGLHYKPYFKARNKLHNEAHNKTK